MSAILLSLSLLFGERKVEINRRQNTRNTSCDDDDSGGETLNGWKWRFIKSRPVVNVPKLLNWVKQDTARPGQQTHKEKLRKLLGAR